MTTQQEPESAHGEPLEPIIETTDGRLIFPDGSEGRPGRLTEAQQRSVDIQNACRLFGQTGDGSELVQLGILAAKDNRFMTPHTVESSKLIAELGELDKALDGLQQQVTLENERTLLALQHLDGDSSDFDQLESMLESWRGEVDVFRVLKLDDDEEFHSNLLAWLLDPNGTHGLAGHFLVEFLRNIGEQGGIRAADRHSTSVLRERHIGLEGERGRLDIRILNEKASFLCAIENKVWSPESGNQLAFYRRALENQYPSYRVRRVFLTPLGAEPEDPEERGHWTKMTYADILGLVERTVEASESSANRDVMSFIRQYAVTLRRNIVPEVSNDVHALARRIYRKHRQAIDLIIENQERYKPDYAREAYGMFRKAIDEHPALQLGTCNPPYLRFLSSDWTTSEDLRLPDWPNWVMFFEMPVRESNSELYLTMYRKGNEAFRRKLFDCAKDNPEIFNCEQDYHDGWLRLCAIGDLLDDSDYEVRWDEEETRRRIGERLDEFVLGKFEQINAIITPCLKEG